MVSEDVNDILLQVNGVKKNIEKEVFKCPRCTRNNQKSSLFCSFCSSPMNTKVAIELDAKRGESDEQLVDLLKIPEVRKAIMNAVKQSK